MDINDIKHWITNHSIGIAAQALSMISNEFCVSIVHVKSYWTLQVLSFILIHSSIIVGHFKKWF